MGDYVNVQTVQAGFCMSGWWGSFQIFSTKSGAYTVRLYNAKCEKLTLNTNT